MTYVVKEELSEMRLTSALAKQGKLADLTLPARHRLLCPGRARRVVPPRLPPQCPVGRDETQARVPLRTIIDTSVEMTIAR